jgi:hypothetical protein
LSGHGARVPQSLRRLAARPWPPLACRALSISLRRTEWRGAAALCDCCRRLASPAAALRAGAGWRG